MKYIYDYSKLLGVMREKNVTQKELSESIKLSETSLNLKLNNNSEFKTSEMIKIMNVLNLPVEQIDQYFFCKDTCENTSH